MNPYTLLAAGVAAVVLFAGGCLLGNNYAKGQAAREELLIKQAGEAASVEAAKAISQIKVNVHPIRERVESTIRELPPTPVECNAPPAVVEAINDARKAS